MNDVEWTYLEVWTGDRLGQLLEKSCLYFCKFRRIHDFEDVFYLIQEHNLLGAIGLGPVLQETIDNLAV